MRKLSGVHLNLEHCGGPRSLSLVSGDVVKRSTARMLLALDSQLRCWEMHP